MSSTTLTIDQLRVSPFNVRTNQEDATATRALEASILARGLILPLVVHPMRGPKKAGLATWGVYAGGRRYRSIRALVDRGDLPSDWPVDVVVRDLPEAEMIEVSAAENLLRRDLRPYELYAAVARANRKGDRPEKIAETLGQEITWVRQALRLGNLAEPIFRALESGRLSVEQAQAYGATEDQALQLAAFEALDALPDYGKRPSEIRRHLRVGDADLARLLRFVGADAYRAAGGRFELDLFADGETERGRVVDDVLLRGLADEALTGLRTSTRIHAQREDLRFVTQAPRSEYGTDYTLQITPKPAPDGAIALPDGDVVALIAIPESGAPTVTYWWASRKAKHGGKAEPVPRTAPRRPVAAGAAIGHQYDDARQLADAAIREDEGLSQEAVQIFRSVRRVILCAALVDDARAGGEVARDYLVWAQLRMLLTETRAPALGMRGLREEGTVMGNAVEKARPHVAATPASRAWGHAIAELYRQTFITGDDLGEAYRDFHASSPGLKNIAAAVVAGLALERSLNADGYRVPMHDVIAIETSAATSEAMRRYWTPTAALLDALPKAQRLAIAEPFVEAATFAGWARRKAGEVTALVLDVVTGASPSIRKSLVEDAQGWVHPLLQFQPHPRRDEAPVGRELAEAAE